ncbi:protein IG [Psittacid alphaherpesvirus 5]|uniref:Protein IG n=1 Tax=Psittacid alphaherpesvirus 5 TaxID=2972693 RepID=A0A5P9JSK6_9ALPH|nr:protein IG [Psittacid alphaherpesvirus 5]QFU14550.1 protein IG [Psittacid alphaherpesvirus 5]UOO01021.1 protein IG [Psittacid alphaherpesvirus 5]
MTTPSSASEVPKGMIVKQALDGLLYLAYPRFKYIKGGYHRTTGNSFVCNHCGVEFSGEPYMKLHVQEHANYARLMCFYCHTPFVLLHKLRSHTKKCSLALARGTEPLIGHANTHGKSGTRKTTIYSVLSHETSDKECERVSHSPTRELSNTTVETDYVDETKEATNVLLALLETDTIISDNSK